MKFTDLLKHDKKPEPIQKPEKSSQELITEKETETPEEILRGNNFKIKLITPTSFGTQITFAKKYDQEIIKKLLTKHDKNINIKFKGNRDIFIVT